MEPTEVRLGQLVQSAVDGPFFRKGALFRIVSLAAGIPSPPLVGCRAVGRAPFSIWYFRPQQLCSPGRRRQADS